MRWGVLIGFASIILALGTSVWAQSSGPTEASLAVLIDKNMAQRPPEFRNRLKIEFTRNETASDIKNLLSETLSLPYLKIETLSPQARIDWKIPETILAIAEFSPHANFNSFFFFYKNSKTSNQNGPLGRTGNKYYVLIDDQKTSLFSISTVLHELAHVHFHALLESYKDKLLTVWPTSWIRRDPSGQYWLEQNLFTYLTERYSHEVQLRFILSRANPLERAEALESFYKLFAGNREQKNLGACIRSLYNGLNSDPSLETLDAIPLTEILQIKNWK